MKPKRIVAFIFALAVVWAGYMLLTETHWFENLISYQTLSFLDIVDAESRSNISAMIPSVLLGIIAFFALAFAPAKEEYREKMMAKGKASQPTAVQASPPVRPAQTAQPAAATKTKSISEEEAAYVVESTNVEILPTFSSIAGYETTKQAMAFIVKCLTQSDSIKKMGASVPTGILLYGPPGTGKTQLAKAVAGTARVPFYQMSGSEFVEKYVGVGAQRVRSLFNTARRHAPCILFIDEIDAIGKTRNSNTNDERQQTLNQILVEISSLSTEKSGVIVIAATNNAESLDPALVRSGRFDRKIAVPLPTKEDRLAILKLYSRKKPVDTSADLNKLAMLTEGRSGSDLATLMNEAALQAVFKGHNKIFQEDIDAALFQMLTGGEQSGLQDPETQKVIAYHEAGHALAIKMLTNDNVPQISIIGSTSGSLGLTMRYSDGNTYLYSKSQMENLIKTYYAGRAAEECYFGNSNDITTGASDDLKRASSLIRDYLTTYGMGSDSLINMAEFSGATDANLTREAKELAKRLYGETVQFLKENRPMLDKIATALVEKKILNEKEFEQILKS